MNTKAAKARTPTPAFADFDDFLRAEGIEDEIKVAVEKRMIALQLENERVAQRISKAELARRVGTSRVQIDRILDPTSQNVTIETVRRVAAAMGKRLHLALVG